VGWGAHVGCVGGGRGGRGMGFDGAV